ncbi:MAG TPA: hypothetical protein VG815_20580 [Chloroflexota bacterium]|nr:hypothetical protein [Chloroflexota bacterium]
MRSKLRVEFFLDADAHNWHYRVPALRTNGGGTATRQAAEQDCLKAIAHTLEGDPTEFDTDASAITLDVSVAPAVEAHGRVNRSRPVRLRKLTLHVLARLDFAND